MGDISKSEKELFEQWAKPDSVQAMVDHEGGYLDYGMRAAFTGWLARSKINQTTARVAELESSVDCGICANRGKVDGLSQETYCDHCIHQEKWRSNQFTAIERSE